MSKDKKNLPTTTEPATTVPAEIVEKVTGKTKFKKGSLEAQAIRTIKSRETKIVKLGKTLASLWIQQGQEILEFMAITDASQRATAELLGLKRTSCNTYCIIASDPRMLNPELQDKLENFTQRDLIKLTKIDDEEVFDQALEKGELPKAEVIIDAEIEDVPEPADVDEHAPEGLSWKDLVATILENSDTPAEFIKRIRDVKFEGEDADTDTVALATEAIELSGESDVYEQAKAIGIKKSVLSKALDGEASKKTIEKLVAYINS